MKKGRLLLVLVGVVLILLLAVVLAWVGLNHQKELKVWLGLEKPPVVLSQKPLFKPLDKFVISLESENSSHYLMLELSLVTHDPEQLEVIESLMPVIRNAMVQFFSKRNLEQVRKDLQEIEALQEALRTRLSATIANYGYKAALDEVLVTKVVLQ